MRDDRSQCDNSDDLPAAFVADLADAAYSVALRHGIAGSWIDLQLDVWRVLARTIAEIGPGGKAPADARAFDAGVEAFLSELTRAAYETMLRHRLRGPFLDFEIELHLALRGVVERLGSADRVRRLFGARTGLVADAVLSRIDRSGKPSAEQSLASDQLRPVW